MVEHFDRARTYRSLIHSDLTHLTLFPCVLANMPLWIRCRYAHHSVENLPPCPLKLLCLRIAFNFHVSRESWPCHLGRITGAQSPIRVLQKNDEIFCHNVSTQYAVCNSCLPSPKNQKVNSNSPPLGNNASRAWVDAAYKALHSSQQLTSDISQ
jgi:hypothetical protein